MAFVREFFESTGVEQLFGLQSAADTHAVDEHLRHLPHRHEKISIIVDFLASITKKNIGATVKNLRIKKLL